MRKYISLLAIIMLSMAVSCKKEPLDSKPAGEADPSGEKIFLWVDAPEQTKVIYDDGLGTSGKGEGGFKMKWEVGDSLFAIRWDAPDYSVDEEKNTATCGKATNNYIVLETIQTGEGGKMLFQGTTRGQWNLSDLKGGEHFVLVHGHFVLDPATDHGVIDFPTSEVTKAGYASHIHHGGIDDGQGGLTFRNQTGTLANLKWHEYMVADAYVRFQTVTETDGNGESVQVRRPYLGKDYVKYESTEDVDTPEMAAEQAVKLTSAHTLVRLTMFMPDDMFDEIDYRLLGISFRTASNDAIFHRYFRLHPNTKGSYGPSGWKVDWNDQGDKESNVYFRANLPGTRKYNEENDPAKPDFNPNMTACVAGTVDGTNGHFVTLYFSLPSRPLAPDTALETPSDLYVSAFTRTHAYRSIKVYKVSADNMRPGKVVNLNINFAKAKGQAEGNNYIKTKAITDPNLGVTFAPGLVYAVKDNPDDADWTYGVYDNQGEYAGLDQQTDVMGDYFLFGSIDPREVFHEHYNSTSQKWEPCQYWNPRWSKESLTVAVQNGTALLDGTTDVAALATIEGHNNIFSSMSKKEADRVWARLQLEAKEGIMLGYYYYDAYAHDTDELRHTAHQARGAHIERFLNSDGQESPENIEKKKTMSSTVGIWIGTKKQPKLEEQDKFVFLPSSHQLSNSKTNMTEYEAVLQDYEDAEHYKYYASTDYGKQHVKCKTQAEYDALDDYQKALYLDIPTKRVIHDEATEYVHHYYLKSELTAPLTGIMKFSTNTRDKGTANAFSERLQIWYTNGSSTFHSSSNVKQMEQTYGRVVRPVIY